MDDLIQLTTSLSLEGGVTFPLPPAAETPPADAPPPPPPPPPAQPAFAAFAPPDDDSDAPLPLAQVVLGADDIIPGVTRAPMPTPTPAHDAPASAPAGGGGGGGAPTAPDLERIRRVLQRLHEPPTGLPPAGDEDASDLAAVEALLRSGAVLGAAAPE